MADIIKRVIENVKAQAILTTQLNTQQQQLDNLRSQSVELSGQMKLLAELYKEDTGDDLNDAINADDALRQLIVSAQQDGMRIAGGTSEDEPEQPTTSEPPKVVSRKSNKKVANKPEPVLAGRTTDRTLPKIVIDDNPPQQGDDED